AECPEIASRIGMLASQKLGCHVPEGPGDAISAIQWTHHLRRFILPYLSRQSPCKTEIENLDQSLRRDDYVGALQIPVNDRTIVRMSKRTGNLNAVAHDGFGRKAIVDDQ